MGFVAYISNVRIFAVCECVCNAQVLTYYRELVTLVKSSFNKAGPDIPHDTIKWDY